MHLSKRFFSFAIGFLAAITLLVGCSAQTPPAKEHEQETPATTEQKPKEIETENLKKLCKVWGYLKYYHPDVIAGKVDWDAQLLEVLPLIMEAKDEASANKTLLDWVGKLTTPPVQHNKNLLSEIRVSPTTQWIHNEDYLGSDLKQKLEGLEMLYITDRQDSYAKFENGFVNFSKEDLHTTMSYADQQMRLLALFRYWNMIEYFYPYKDIIEEDWDAVLTEFIPKFMQGEDKASYVLAIAELTTRIHDAHVGIYDKESTMISYWGEYIAPIEFVYLSGDVVVSHVLRAEQGTCALKVGDVIKSFGGKQIEDLIAEHQKYISVPQPDKFAATMWNTLFRSSKQAVEVTVERENQVIAVTVELLKKQYLPQDEKDSYEILENNIGLINPGYLKANELDDIMKKLWDTRGIVIDLRQYPSDFITYSLADYINPDQEVFCRGTFADMGQPGQFFYCQDMQSGGQGEALYTGKVAILMNENSISNAEFTVMSLRNAPNAQVIGSASRGADGNVIEIPMPGGIATTITGIGIYTPDSGETQRVGLVPDREVAPTVEGLVQGKDELLDAAVNYILEK